MYLTDKEAKIKEYIKNYLFELQRHFDMPDKKMRLILYEVYKDSKGVFVLKTLIKKYISMVKSSYINKIKGIK